MSPKSQMISKLANPPKPSDSRIDLILFSSLLQYLEQSEPRQRHTSANEDIRSSTLFPREGGRQLVPFQSPSLRHHPLIYNHMDRPLLKGHTIPVKYKISKFNHVHKLSQTRQAPSYKSVKASAFILK